jgi:FlgD Ig-like domain/Protein of unknown function (DUF1565)
MKLAWFMIVIILSMVLCAEEWIVKQDGTGDYSSIQAAIDNAVEGDEILVYPGRYYENINPQGKCDLSIYSLEYTTGNEAYIDSTIIDGTENGACINLINGEQNWIIRGFSITGGSGYSSLYSSSSIGGGVAIHLCTLSLINCEIYGNYAFEGGAINTDQSDLYLSGVSIHDNIAYEFGGGIIFNAALIPGAPVYEIEFDTENRCSIYHNYGPVCQDLFLQRTEDAEVYLDSVSVADPGNYFIYCRNGTYSLDYLNTVETEMDADLYVAPGGDDDNSGLTDTDPWKTIHKALYRIKSNPNYPNTVHLDEGVYRYSEGQSPYPLCVKSYVTLHGAGSGETILDCENDDIMQITIEEQGSNVEISGLTIENYYSNFVSPIESMWSNEISFYNLEFYNNQTERLAFAPISTFNFYSPTNLIMDNIYIHECSSDIGAGMNIDNIIGGTFTNITIEDCYSYGDDDVRALMRIVVYDGDVFMENITIRNNVLDTNCDFDWRNCLAINVFPWDYECGTITLSNSLIADNTCIGEYDKAINFLASGTELNMINNTIINNTSNFYSTGVAAPLINYYNNISRNEDGWTDIELWVSYQNGDYPEIIPSEINIGCNNIEDSDSAICNFNNVSTINWLEGNIDENPDFDETSEWDYSLLADSPCTDSGTEIITGNYQFPVSDLAGNQRIWGACIDMGCLEYQLSGYSENEIITAKRSLFNYPNPFNPSTTIEYAIKEACQVELSVYNIKGQLVKHLVDELREPGYYQTFWDGKDKQGSVCASGIYFSQMKAGKEVIRDRMLLVK